MGLSFADIRKDFLQLDSMVNGKPFVYLDSAASSLKPKVVGDVVARHYHREASNVHRGVHYYSEMATRQFEEVRHKAAKFLNAPTEKEIVFTSGTTAAINLVAHSFSSCYMTAGDEVIISHMEHHSNIVPWQMLCERFGYVLKVVPIDDAGVLDLNAYKAMLSEKTKLVSMVYVSNSLGTINPIAEVVELARGVGAKVMVDAAQAAPHMPLDVQALGCDFLAFSAHKIFGPTGVGILYGKKELLQVMPPYMGGGDMIRTVSFKRTTFADIPYKFEAGTPNISGVIGLGAAFDYLQQFDMRDLMRYEQGLLAYAHDEVLKVPGLRLVGNAPEKASIVAFVLDDIHPHDIGSIVDAEGVAIRTGHHCCQPVMDRFGLPATARASLAFYNNERDIDALVKALYRVREIFA